MVTQTKILLTGFEPFGLLTENPSQVVTEALSMLKWDNAEVRHLILPVEFIVAHERITDFYRGEWFPDIVLHLGVASSRQTITLERFAVNMMDTANSDNTGYRPNEVPIITDAPLAYQATMPCKGIVEYLREMGLEAKISNSAGTFVCNAVLFTSLHILSTYSLKMSHHTARDISCGFIHLPLFDKIDKELQIKTIKTIIQWLIKKHRQQAFQEYPSHGNAQ